MIARLLELLKKPSLCLRLPEELRPIAAYRFPSACLVPNESYIPDHIELMSVGDTLTRTLLARDIYPRLAIVDCREKRVTTACPEPPSGYKVLRTWNPPATITSEAISVLSEALRVEKAFIVVDGEEDLLVLPLVLLAPIDSIVAYGQPGQGIVLVHVNRRTKQVAYSLLEDMSLSLCERGVV